MCQPTCRGPAATHDLRGFSLFELLVAMAVFGALLALGTPAYSNWIASQQLANEAHYLAETLQRARSEAIKHGYRVNVCKTRNLVGCTEHGAWDSGWLMYVDANHNGQVDDDELILHRQGPASDGISIQGNRPVADYVSYTSLGHARLLNGGLQMGTFVVCKSGQNALKVVLANTARAESRKPPSAALET